MKKYIIITFFVLGFFKIEAQRFDSLMLNQNGSGSRIEVKIEKGKAFNHPSFAIWLANTDSSYIQTIYVSKSVGSGYFGHARKVANKWEAGPLKLPAALPFWVHQWMGTGAQFPSQENPVPDAYTGATPTNSVVITAKLDKTIQNEILIFLEVNQTWDWNEHWTNNKYPDNEAYKTSCQPSVVYAAKYDVKKPGIMVLNPIGHGHYAGENGKLYKDLSTLTTALEIFKEIKVQIQ